MVERKYDIRWVTSITFEKSVFDRVTELLPKGVTIPDIVNEILREKLSDLEREQKIKDGLSDKSAIRIYEVGQTNDKNKDTFKYILQSDDDELLDALRMLPLDKRENVFSKLQRNYMRSIYEEESEKEKDNEILEADKVENKGPLTPDEYKIVQEYSHPSKKATREVIELRRRLHKHGIV